MVSVELFSYADAHTSGPADRLYRELVEQAVVADDLGYRRLWLTEQHLSAPGRVPDSLQMLAYIAARTSRLRLGTGVLPAAVHDPVLLIESVLQLDVLSDGRVDLGVGSGSEAGPILEALGLTPGDTAARTGELYGLLEQVRPGRTVRVPGPEATLELELDPAPRRPLLDQVWTAAGRSALELTSTYGTGLLLPRPMSLADRLALAAAYRAAVPEGRVVHFKAGSVASSSTEARRRAAGFVQDYARRYLGVRVGGPDTADFADAVERLDFAVGTADEVAGRMRTWLEGFSDDDGIAIQLGGPGVRHEDVLDALERFAPQIEGLDARPIGVRAVEDGRPPEEEDVAAVSSPALERLRRWEAAGGGWHVVRIGTAGAVVQLERCDLGEAVDSISSADPAFLTHLRAHPASDG